MNKFLVILSLISVVAQPAISDSDLNAQNNQNEQLNPINDDEHADNSSNNQDKRTILNPVSSVGWAKHVGIGKHGGKYVIGYSSVDLKLTPVIRPIGIKHTGYRYGKPNIHFHIKSPAILKPRPVGGGWKPIIAVSKPVAPAIKPGPFDVVHQQPVPHVDHVHSHVDHVHGVPAHVDNVHTGPPHVDNVHAVHHVDHVHHVPHLHQVPHLHVDHIHGVPSHIDQVHQVQVVHGDHIDAVNHIDHIHPTHIHQLSATIPVASHLKPVLQQPYLPSQILFEVTKPNLGVLPLGAIFPHPVLPDFRHVHLRPAFAPQPLIPVAQPLPAPAVAPVPQPVIPHLPPPQPPLHIHPVQTPAVPLPVPHPLPHPAVHFSHPIAPAHYPLVPTHPPIPSGHEAIHPVTAEHEHYPPGTVVEYHGTRNFVPYNGLQPLIPQTPVNAVHPNQPHLHFNGFSGVNTEAAVPSNVWDQQLPSDEHQHFQQPPLDTGNPNFLQQPLPSAGEANFQAQQYLPQEVSNIQHYDGATSSAVIQPGQSDLQFPFHLPQHHFVPQGKPFQPGNFHDPSQYPDNVASASFRPSIQLEPPYKRK